MPIPFPIVSIHESFSHPTSMFLRNLMAMDAEEMIRAQPMDSVVLIGGCDKTVPALLMAAASVDLPAILEVTGPMITGSWRGERLGACTDCRRFWAMHRAGKVDAAEIAEIGDRLAPGPGTCMVMGTASTMALVSEALGMMLPGGGAIRRSTPTGSVTPRRPAPRRSARPERRPRPSEIMQAALLNAIRAPGGRRLDQRRRPPGRRRRPAGSPSTLDEVDRLAPRRRCWSTSSRPDSTTWRTCRRRAGWRRCCVRSRLRSSWKLATVDGRTLGEAIAAAPAPFPQEVVRPASNPIHSGGGIRVLHGNLAPNGALIKQAAASSTLLVHTGRAVVFDLLRDLAEQIDDPDLEVAAEDVLVLRNAGPKGAPGMPEAGYIPIPKKLAAQGVKDMVRISDARMSGTAFGTIVLHISPEAAVGGPLALVETGDAIALDVAAGRIDLLVDAPTLEARRAAWRAPPPHPGSDRGYLKLYLDEVLQAEDGCDFDFLRRRPRATSEG
ncbi:MAG: dihydroxy-acid dehydratase [Myxococcota bacterium]